MMRTVLDGRMMLKRLPDTTIPRVRTGQHMHNLMGHYLLATARGHSLGWITHVRRRIREKEMRLAPPDACSALPCSTLGLGRDPQKGEDLPNARPVPGYPGRIPTGAVSSVTQ
eukprot:3850883-Rhodomonas_salina.1